MNKKTVLVLFATTLLTLACGQDEQAALESGVHLDALDRSTRPQDDFYQFVNGGWLDSTEIPEIYSGYTVYHEVNERVEEALRTIIIEAAESDAAPGTEAQQVGDIYSTWMDTEAINAKGIEPLRGWLERVNAIDSKASMTAVMAELVRLGTNVPYGVGIWADLKDSSQYAVYLSQGGITMPNRDYYLELDNDKFAKAREGLPVYIAKMLVRAGVDQASATAAAGDVYALEAAIAEAHWDAVRNRDPQQFYNPYPLPSLPELGDGLNWAASLDTLGLSGVEQLVVGQPSYFEALDGIIAETPLATWKHYLTFRLLDGAASYLDETTDGIRFGYRNRTLYGQEEQQPRWKRGITVVNGLVGEAVGKLYVAEHFPPEAKAKMEELVQNVIATLALSLDDLEWMTPQTREGPREAVQIYAEDRLPRRLERLLGARDRGREQPWQPDARHGLELSARPRQAG